jgi:glycosyltransferase involved in cell wall biosynthesis
MISAIISTYNREKFLLKALNSIGIQSIDKKLIEVVIVNNNSTDSTHEISTRFIADNPQLKCKYVIEANQGLSFARNRGIAEAEGKYLTFVDDDAHLDVNFLKVVYDYFENHLNVVAIGGKIELDYEGKEPVWLTHYIAPLFGYFDMGDKELEFPKTNFPRGSNMSFRSEIFKEAGDFNTHLGRVGRNMGSGEEKDLFYRIYNRNYKVDYVPTAIVYHAVPLSRTTDEFLRRQSEGIGSSEWIRAKEAGVFEMMRRIAYEIMAWAGSFLLFLFYLIKLQIPKGIMLLKFRCWVTRGFLFSWNKC